MTTHTIHVNPRPDGRFEVVVDGVVHRCTYDEVKARELMHALIRQTMSPDKRDRMLGAAIGRSGM